LRSEISVLSLAIELLIEEVEGENSPLVQAGERNMKLAIEVIGQSNATLKDLEAFGKKYDINQVTGKRQRTAHMG
jgi:hypothetical protein